MADRVTRDNRMIDLKPPTPPDSASAASGRVGELLVCVMAVLVVGSTLLLSSPEFRAGHLLVASMVAAIYARRLLGPLMPGMGWTGVIFGGGLIVVHAASWLGGLLHGEGFLTAAARGLAGLLGVLGLAVFTVVMLQPRWRRFGKWTALGVLLLLLAGSFVGFFIGLDGFGTVGTHSFRFDQLRMSLIWPTRMLTAPLGQISWDHTNYAAFHFALALALVLEFLGSGGKGRGWWCLCVLLGTAVFLTASRGGWLMLAVAGPLVLAGRKPRFALQTLGLLALCIGLGYVCLKVKLKHSPPTAQVASAAMANHGSALVKRGNAGRFEIYQLVWKELESGRLCGQGLGAVGGPVGPLEHEHSVYMATLRGGGVIGLAGHLLVIGSAAWAAFGLMRRGLRWPAVLLATVLSGLLFDRSTVIGISGHYEFIAHWVAVLLPLLLAASWRERGELAGLHGGRRS